MRVPVTWQASGLLRGKLQLSWGPICETPVPSAGSLMHSVNEEIMPSRVAKDTPPQRRKESLGVPKFSPPVLSTCVGLGFCHASAWVALSNCVIPYRNFHSGISPSAAPHCHSHHLSLPYCMKLCHHFSTFVNLGFLYLLPGCTPSFFFSIVCFFVFFFF